MASTTSSRRRCVSRANARQAGAALVVALVILLVLTVLGVTAMETSNMEQEMGIQYHDQQLAFQAAEGALVDAQNYIQSQTLTANSFTAGCDNGLCLPANPVSGAYPVWSDPTLNVWGTAGLHKTGSYQASNVSQQPEYIIEWMGYVFPPDVSPPKGVLPGPGDPEMFRVTALGTGGTTNARVMLQITYEKDS